MYHCLIYGFMRNKESWNNKVNLIKIRSLIARDCVAHSYMRDIKKPGAIKDRILIRLQQSSSRVCYVEDIETDEDCVFMGSEWLLFNANSVFYSAISWREQVNFQWWVLLCTWPTRLDAFFYSASSLKQQSTEKHVTPLGNSILISSHSGFFSLFLLNAACLAHDVPHSRWAR